MTEPTGAAEYVYDAFPGALERDGTVRARHEFDFLILVLQFLFAKDRGAFTRPFDPAPPSSSIPHEAEASPADQTGRTGCGTGPLTAGFSHKGPASPAKRFDTCDQGIRKLDVELRQFSI